MKDREKIQRVAKAQWKKCELSKMITPESALTAELLFITGFEIAIDYLISLPWPDGFKMLGYQANNDNEPNDYFEDFSPLEESTI